MSKLNSGKNRNLESHGGLLTHLNVRLPYKCKEVFNMLQLVTASDNGFAAHPVALRPRQETKHVQSVGETCHQEAVDPNPCRYPAHAIYVSY